MGGGGRGGRPRGGRRVLRKTHAPEGGEALHSDRMHAAKSAGAASRPTAIRPAAARRLAGGAGAAAESKPKALVLGIASDETVAAIARYAVPAVAILAAAWVSGVTVERALATPRSAAGAFWRWLSESDK